LIGVRTVPPAPWYALSANVITVALVNAVMMAWVRAAVRSRVEPGIAADAHTRR